MLHKLDVCSFGFIYARFSHHHSTVVLMTPIALFDLDGTLANYDKAMREHLKLLKSPHEPSFDDFWDAPEHIEQRMRLIKKQPGWWLDLEPIESGFEILDLAGDLGFEIRVLTKGPYYSESAWTEKLQWCKKYLPHCVQVTITMDKSAVYGRVLVDDYTDYMSSWLSNRPRGLGIMPLNEQNKDFRHKNVIHYDGSNLDAIREKLIWARDRGDGMTGIVCPTCANTLPEGWSVHKRTDRGIIEHICPHGVGHPCMSSTNDGIHGCDGCCKQLRELYGK